MDENREGRCPITDEAYIRKPKRAGLSIQLMMFAFFIAKTFAGKKIKIANTIFPLEIFVKSGMAEEK
jgi:hypothetical protein